MENIKNIILEILEKNSRVSIEDMAAMLGMTADEIAAAIDEMINDQIICGYTTLINWDKTEREFVTAMIEVKVTPQRDRGFEKIAERISGFEEVKAVYLMAGAYDLLVMMDGKNIRDISYFISSKLSPLDSVLSTSTHFVLKKYKDHGVVFEKKKEDDERMIVTP
ncbi:MAG: Lrp/AsnC family transcriptional regulator [Clostridia bacterium]|nr:Lrp/AsnC family transcriptional regulator [Clostridia bacterium]